MISKRALSVHEYNLNKLLSLPLIMKGKYLFCTPCCTHFNHAKIAQIYCIINTTHFETKHISDNKLLVILVLQTKSQLLPQLSYVVDYDWLPITFI